MLESDKDKDGIVEDSERPQGVEDGYIIFKASIRDINDAESLATIEKDTRVTFTAGYTPGGGRRAADASDIDMSNADVYDSNRNEVRKNSDGSYTIKKGESDLFIKIPVLDDATTEDREYFTLSASTDNLTISTTDNSIGSINEDSDLDRIGPDVEDYLERLLEEEGIINDTTIYDPLSGDEKKVNYSELNQITPLAWKSKQAYLQALEKNVTDRTTLILIEAVDEEPDKDTGKPIDIRDITANNRYQMIKPEVLDESDLQLLESIDGKPTLESLKGLTATGSDLKTDWDALSLSVTYNEAYKEEKVDALPNKTTIIRINTILTGATVEDFNGYAKYISSEAYDYAVENGLELKTPSGVAITGPGWWDFTYNESSGIGAKLHDNEGRITTIELYLKDSSVYDINTSNDTIKDPGIPFYLVANVQKEIPSGGGIDDDTVESETNAPPSTPEEELNPPTEGSNPPTEGSNPPEEEPDQNNQLTTEPPTVNDGAEDELKQPTVTIEAEQAGILEIASINITDKNSESLFENNRYIEETSLFREIQQESFNSLVEWADSSGLISTTENISNEADEKPNTTTAEREDKSVEEPRPLAFVADALKDTPGTNSKLLETLILGGGLLYALDRASGNRGSNWIKRLLPATPGMFLVGGVYERVITVFRAEDRQGLDRVVAAKITDERIEILAEQQLPMDLEAAATKSDIDIQRELEELVTKVTNEAGGKRDLLLYDPYLKNELKIYEDLGEENDELKPQKLHQMLSQLNEIEVRQLENWLKAPSSSKNNVSPVRNHLQRRQSQLRKILSHEKSVLVSILELSLAMSPKIVI